MEKKQVTLPTGALRGARFEAFAPTGGGGGGGGALVAAPLAGSPTAMSLAASPSGMAMCTPSNVATTVWRTYVCPSAPVRKQGDASSLFGSPTSAISATMSPMGDGFRMGLPMAAIRAGRPGSAPPCDDAGADFQPSIASVSSGSSVSGAMPVCTPSDAATTAWRTSTCPDAPARTRQTPMTLVSPSGPGISPGSGGPKNLFPSPAGGTPARGFEVARRSWSDAAGQGAHLLGGCSPQSGILFMPEPRRAGGGRPPSIRTALDSNPPSAAGTPMGTPLNTAFIGTPGSRGGYHMAMDPTSPFFGKCGVPADVTPVAATTGAVRTQVLSASTPLHASEATKGSDSTDVEMALEASPKGGWGQLGA